MNRSRCSVPGCNRKLAARGRCVQHDKDPTRTIRPTRGNTQDRVLAWGRLSLHRSSVPVVAAETRRRQLSPSGMMSEVIDQWGEGAEERRVAAEQHGSMRLPGLRSTVRMTSRTLTAILATSLLVLGSLACGTGAAKDTCRQVGPPQGHPLRPLDAFIAAGYPSGEPLDALGLHYGGAYAQVPPNQYPQVCVSAYNQDRAGYRYVGWVDDFAYRDGGQNPLSTYCANPRDAGCAPQPGQLHGQVVVTIHEGANNIIVIPLSP